MKTNRLLLLLCLILGGGMLHAEDFRFALFTDLHVSEGGPGAEDLRDAVRQVNTMSGIDFVLVTGDLTESGDRVSLRQVKSLLDELTIRYYIIPGNHETKWSESGVTDFGHIFGSERFSFQHKGFLFLGFNSGPLMRMADGHVVPQDITWMQQELSKVGKEQKVLLATHYPLKDGDVDNWFDVTDAVRPYNIRAFLGGHYHSNRTFFYDGIPGLLNRSTLRGKAKTGGFSVYEVAGDSLKVYEQTVGGDHKQWASISLTKSYYSLQGAQDKYPSYAVNKEYGQVKEVWLKQTGVGIYSSPAVYKDKIYVGDDMGFLTCYRLTDGKKFWSFQSGNRIVGTPAVADGIVVFGSADGKIYGLNANNGKQKWVLQAAEPVLGAVKIQKGVAYVGASDGTFRAIEIRSGLVKWSYDKVKGYIETMPLLVDNKVIFGAWDNTLYALEQSSGKELWRWTGGIRGMHYSPAAVWPVSSHGKVFITDPQRAMTAIDLETGQTVWRTKQSMVRETIGLSEDGERIFSKTMNDSVVCYSASGNEPRQVWAANLAFGYEHAPSMQIEKDGVVFGSTKGGLIFALDSSTGKVLWKHKVGNSLINTVMPLNGQEVLFTATGGQVGILSTKEKK